MSNSDSGSSESLWDISQYDVALEGIDPTCVGLYTKKKEAGGEEESSKKKNFFVSNAKTNKKTNNFGFGG